MKCKEIMRAKVEFIDEDENIVYAAKVMSEKGLGCVIVTKDKEIAGIVTERDILKNAVGVCKDIKLKKIMSKEVFTIDGEAYVEDAIDLMKEKKIKKLPVVEGDKIVGMITATDLIAFEDRLIEKLAGIFPINRRERLVGD
jgi:CBS domain-containing protein